MPSYRIFHLKENLRAHFRQLPHLSGVAQLKPRDFQEGREITARNRYAAWRALKEEGTPLQVGDALLEDSAQLYITKFVGLEPAEWIVPEVKVAPEAELATA